MNAETLIPKIGVVTDIRIDTPDVKTFRVVGLDGKKVFEHMPGQCAMLGLFCATRSVKNAGFHEKHGILHVSSVFRRHFHSHLAQ